MSATETDQSRKASDSAADPVYRALRLSIVTGALAGNTPLRQDAIARQHSVSKVPVREALRRLETEGFVRFERNRGAFVRLLSATEIRQLLDVRLVLECRALELAIPNMIDSDIRGLRELLDGYAQENSPAHWSLLNLHFHNRLYEPCENTHLLSMIKDVQEKIGPYTRLVVTEATGLDRPMREHEKILQACIERNIQVGVDLLRRHIETTGKEVAAHLRRSDRMA